MFLCFIFNNSSFLFQIFYYFFICIFHIYSFISRNFICEFTIFIKWNNRIIRRNNFLSNTHFIIIISKTWSTMNNSCTCIICNKICCLYSKTSIFCSFREKIKYWNIFYTFQFGTWYFLNYLELFLTLIFLFLCFIE